MGTSRYSTPAQSVLETEPRLKNQRKQGPDSMQRSIKFLLDNSLFLIFGAVAGLVWANANPEAYKNFVNLKLFESSLFYDHTMANAGQGHFVTLHYLVNDIFMALFFAIAGKEVWEATFPGGPLNSPKTAATPLIATFAGMAGPAALYLAGAALLGQLDALSNGWAIPCATDIAFSYLVARLVFGAGHPAIPFLLLVAIADDALGLIILAVVYPQGDVNVMWLLLSAASMFIAHFMKTRRILSFWPYLLIAGSISWVGFALAGLHPALGLLPIIPFMPHAHVDTGLFDWSRLERHDTLSAFEHWWKNPVELILGLFGLLNAGVVISSVGPATTIVLLGLLVGKPLGIWLFGIIAARVFKFGLPEGMNGSDLFVLGCAAGIGFTVALFVTTVAFPTGSLQDAAKMGALGSFGAAVVTLAAARVLKVGRYR